VREREKRKIVMKRRPHQPWIGAWPEQVEALFATTGRSTVPSRELPQALPASIFDYKVCLVYCPLAKDSLSDAGLRDYSRLVFHVLKCNPRA
jgi:hypothetical protein